MSNTFRFKQFTISQEHAALKLGTDAVLLGCLTTFDSPTSILDIGTGTGILSLMMAQKYSCPITAIDMDAQAIIDAKINIQASPWNDRIEAKETSLQDFARTTKQTFDSFICNPPFFTNSLKNPDTSKTIARHAVTLDANTLFSNIEILGSEQYTASIIIPCTEKEKYAEAAMHHNLHLIREITVFPFISTEKANRSILKFSNKWNNFSQSTIAIRSEDKSYTNTFKQLTKEFYLNTEH